MTTLRPIPTTMFSMLLLAGCGSESTPPHAAPSKTEAVAHESDLLRLELTPEAQARPGIATVRIGTGSAALTRETSGEIVVPAGPGGVPTISVSNLAQMGTQQVAADGEIARTQARTSSV